MSKRPIRVTMSMTPEEYDRLCWLGFYWGENPSTLANAMLQEAVERKLNASTDLQKQFAAYRKSKLQTVPGRATRREEGDGERSDPLPG